jgi:predicted transcriptional regulator
MVTCPKPDRRTISNGIDLYLSKHPFSPLRLKMGYNYIVSRIMAIHCEYIVKYVIPALRMLISRQLVENYNLNQIQVAKLLQVTQPSVSNYMGRRKGSTKMRRFLNNTLVNEYATSLAKKIFEKNLLFKDLNNDLCDLCIKLRKGGYLTG